MAQFPEFFSNFDSGNLNSAILVPHSCCLPLKCRCAEPIDLEYNLTVRSDAEESQQLQTNSYRTWFYFGIKDYPHGTKVRLNITNLRKQSKLFRMGHKPFVRVGETGSWERISSDVKFRQERDNFVVSFVFTFPLDSDSIYFALSPPYSYGELQAELKKLKLKYADVTLDSPYVCVETVCQTQLGLDVNLVTISSTDGMLDEQEDRLNGLFPDTMTPRCRKFKDKKVVFVSARVHPGEVCSSYVLRGLMEFLLHPEDLRADHLRRNFVFKFIPMLNPDGVFRGHFRGDLNGINLNRVYGNPSFELYPSIYAAQTLLAYYQTNYTIPDPFDLPPSPPIQQSDSYSAAVASTPKKTNFERLLTPRTPVKHRPTTRRSKSSLNSVRRNLFGSPKTQSDKGGFSPSADIPFKPEFNGNVAFYIDLHGHVSKAGCFLYGNHLDLPLQTDTLMFAKLMAINCRYFDLNGCVFSKENMKQTDPIDKSLSKEGAGRVVAYKSLGIIHSYTLECHYCGGEVTDPVFMIGSRESANRFMFTSQAYMEVGKAIGLSVLDFIGANPQSQLSRTMTPTLSALRDWASATLQNESPKKRQSKVSSKENEDTTKKSLSKRLRRCSITLESGGPTTSKDSGKKMASKRRVVSKSDVGGKSARLVDGVGSLQNENDRVGRKCKVKRSPIRTRFLRFKYPTGTKKAFSS